MSIVPRGSGKTLDFLVDGIPTELKTITRLAVNTVKNALQTASRQGEQILIDAPHLEQELARGRKLAAHDDEGVFGAFLADLEALAEVSERERNPIVFT